jgi:hypothetical protein
VLISIYNYCSYLTGRTKWENGSDVGNYAKLDSGLSKGKLYDINYKAYVLESILYTQRCLNSVSLLTPKLYKEYS